MVRSSYRRRFLVLALICSSGKPQDHKDQLLVVREEGVAKLAPSSGAKENKPLSRDMTEKMPGDSALLGVPKNCLTPKNYSGQGSLGAKVAESLIWRRSGSTVSFSAIGHKWPKSGSKKGFWAVAHKVHPETHFWASSCQSRKTHF